MKRVRAYNQQIHSAANVQVQEQLKAQRNKAAKLEIKVRKLETEQTRVKRISEKQRREFEEREEAYVRELIQQQQKVNEQLRVMRDLHKVLKGIPEEELCVDTRILVTDTNWLLDMTPLKVQRFLQRLDQCRNLYLFVPSAVVDELDRLKSRREKTRRDAYAAVTSRSLVKMLSECTSPSLIVHTTVQLSTEALNRLQALKDNTDNQILEIYYEVAKCTSRTPVLLTADAVFQMKVNSNRCIALKSTSMDEIIEFASKYSN